MLKNIFELFHCQYILYIALAALCYIKFHYIAVYYDGSFFSSKIVRYAE